MSSWQVVQQPRRRRRPPWLGECEDSGSADEDDAARTGDSVAYIPDAASAGSNVPAAVRSKRDHLFACLPEARRWLVQVDDVAMYSVTEARRATAMAATVYDAVLRYRAAAAAATGFAAVAEAPRPVTVTDATACVGGNVLAFAFRGMAVTAVEVHAGRAAMLRANVALLPLAAATRVTIVHGDYVALADTLQQDAVFIDPPWGGPGAPPTPTLHLGGVDVVDLICRLTAGASPRAVVVALKAPVTFDVGRLRAALAPTGAHVDRVDDLHRMLLIVVVAALPATPSTCTISTTSS